MEDVTSYNNFHMVGFRPPSGALLNYVMFFAMPFYPGLAVLIVYWRIVYFVTEVEFTHY